MKTSPHSPLGRTERVYDHREVLTAVLEMERNGVYLDTALCEDIRLKAAGDEAEVLADLRAWAREKAHPWLGYATPDEVVDDVWSSSTVGLPRFLHSEDGLGLPPSPIFAKGRVRDGEVSTDHAAIDYLASHYPQYREGLRSLVRLRQTRSALKYTTKFPGFIQHDGLIHPVFGASDSDGGDGGTVTERATIKKPELAQWPRNAKKDHYQLRRMLVAGPEGQVVVGVDAQALEVWVLADYLIWRLDDDRLAHRMSSPVDIHSQTTADLFPELGLTGEQVMVGKGLDEWPTGGEALDPRSRWPLPGRPPEWAWAKAWDRTTIPTALGTMRDEVAKVTRYAIHYGKGGWGLGHTMLDGNGDPIGEEVATALIQRFLDKEPWLDLYMDEVWWRLSRFGGITALDGHALDVKALWSTKWGKWSAFRKGLNYPMQKGAARLVNLWMWLVATDPLLKRLGYLLRLQIHDELVGTCPENVAPEAVQRVKWCLGEACRLAGLLVTVPSEGGFGPTWHDAKGH